jgi:hypothetical protein
MTTQAARKISYLVRVFANPMVEKMQTRGARRRRVIWLAICGVVYALAPWATKQVWIIIPLYVPLMLLIGQVNLSVRGVTELNDRALDERQRALRDRANRVTHRWTWMAGIALGIVLCLGFQLSREKAIGSDLFLLDAAH